MLKRLIKQPQRSMVKMKPIRICIGLSKSFRWRLSRECVQHTITSLEYLYTKKHVRKGVRLIGSSKFARGTRTRVGILRNRLQMIFITTIMFENWSSFARIVKHTNSSNSVILGQNFTKKRHNNEPSLLQSCPFLRYLRIHSVYTLYQTFSFHLSKNPKNLLLN